MLISKIHFSLTNVKRKRKQFHRSLAISFFFFSSSLTGEKHSRSHYLFIKTSISSRWETTKNKRCVSISHTIVIHFFRTPMDHSIFNDHNRQQTSFPSHTNFPHIASTRKLTDMNKKSKSGIIQLNLHTSDNHLTLKSIDWTILSISFLSLFLVIRVKGIQSYLSNILIKITFIPDQKPLECHTRAVPNLHGTGIFNEKFTFEINDDDIHKRLCFSIYDYNHQTNEMNFQGCLSFGIRNTLKKQKVSFIKTKKKNIEIIFLFTDSRMVLYSSGRYRRISS